MWQHLRPEEHRAAKVFAVPAIVSYALAFVMVVLSRSDNWFYFACHIVGFCGLVGVVVVNVRAWNRQTRELELHRYD